MAQPAVDLGAHVLALGGGVVVSAVQSDREQLASRPKRRDLGIEGGEPLPRDRLPVRDDGGVEDSADVVDRQARALAGCSPR
jgi:hypothetical protein